MSPSRFLQSGRINRAISPSADCDRPPQPKRQLRLVFVSRSTTIPICVCRTRNFGWRMEVAVAGTDTVGWRARLGWGGSGTFRRGSNKSTEEGSFCVDLDV